MILKKKYWYDFSNGSKVSLEEQNKFLDEILQDAYLYFDRKPNKSFYLDSRSTGDTIIIATFNKYHKHKKMSVDDSKFNVVITVATSTGYKQYENYKFKFKK